MLLMHSGAAVPPRGVLFGPGSGRFAFFAFGDLDEVIGYRSDDFLDGLAAALQYRIGRAPRV